MKSDLKNLVLIINYLNLLESLFEFKIKVHTWSFINGSNLVSFIADLLYKANLNTGSVLEYALAFTSAALDKYCSKWSAAPKTGFIDITISRDFYRIYSGLQIVRSNLPRPSFTCHTAK